MQTMAQDRHRLIERYGRPKPVDAGEALRLIGKRDEVHPRDVIACVYQGDEAVDAFLDVNHRHEGMVSIGRVTVEDGVLAVTDLRPQLRRMGSMVTDPALPDDYRP